MAKLFAQVTTAATPLDDLHNEWLTFAFALDEYAPSKPSAAANQNAMRAVAELCRVPLICNQTQSNPFHNHIRFNAHDANPCGPLPGGFKYTCNDLKDLTLKHYYDCSANYGRHLQPLELAEQMAMAFHALVSCVQAPHPQTVFFGDSRHEQRIMQDAFWAGVFSAILKNGPKTDWRPLLTNLQFPQTSWTFNWVKTLNGSIGTISRKLALDVLSRSFAAEQLPTASGNLADYLKGNDAEVELEFSRLTPSGRPTKVGRSQQLLRGGNILSPTITPAKHFRVRKKSGNIGRLDVVDAQHPPGKPVLYNERGETLDSAKHSNPLKLVLRMHHYGGIESSAQVELTW